MTSAMVQVGSCSFVGCWVGVGWGFVVGVVVGVGVGVGSVVGVVAGFVVGDGSEEEEPDDMRMMLSE